MKPITLALIHRRLAKRFAIRQNHVCGHWERLGHTPGPRGRPVRIWIKPHDIWRVFEGAKDVSVFNSLTKRRAYEWRRWLIEQRVNETVAALTTFRRAGISFSLPR